MAHPAWGLSTSTPPWCQAAGANTRFAWGTLGQSDTPLPSAPPSHSPQPTRLPSCRASVRWEAFTLSHVSFQRSGTCPSSISRLCSSCGGIQASAQEGTRPQGPLSLSRGVQPTATLSQPCPTVCMGQCPTRGHTIVSPGQGQTQKQRVRRCHHQLRSPPAVWRWHRAPRGCGCHSTAR